MTGTNTTPRESSIPLRGGQEKAITLVDQALPKCLASQETSGWRVLRMWIYTAPSPWRVRSDIKQSVSTAVPESLHDAWVAQKLRGTD